jgi:hypothetical protein
VAGHTGKITRGRWLAAGLLSAWAWTAQAQQVIQQFDQPESRDASGRITVEAAHINVISCSGRTIYIYGYGRDQLRVVPGFRAVLPPPAGNWTIIGGDFPTYQQAVASACGTAALSPQFAYRGCYRDNANRDINDFSFEQGNVTNEVCVQTCSSKGMSVAATQYGSFCFCGHTYGTLGAADNCNMPCAGNNGEICGGPWANTVFSR